MRNLEPIYYTGIEYFRGPDLQSLKANDYFVCLKNIRPLLAMDSFLKAEAGFYINWIKNLRSGGYDDLTSLRLHYYTKNNNPNEIPEVIQSFANNNPNTLSLYAPARELPNSNVPPEESDAYNLRFRNFLNSYTQIALDLLESLAEKKIRLLIANYRLNQYPLPTVQSCFEDVFKNNSKFYNQQEGNYTKQQLWEDFERSDSTAIWKHMFIEMLLPGDYPYYDSPIPDSFKKQFLKEIQLD